MNENNLSRQRLWQIKAKLQGMCQRCGLKGRKNKNLCAECSKKGTQEKNNWYKKNRAVKK